MFSCDKCGELNFGLLDGYGVGDTLLEGVKFEIRSLGGGKFSATTQAKDARYMADLNEKKWLKEVADAARSEDTLECPKCGGDIDGPGCSGWAE